MLCYCHRCQPRFRKREKFRPQLLRLRRYSTHLAEGLPRDCARPWCCRDAFFSPGSCAQPPPLPPLLECQRWDLLLLWFPHLWVRHLGILFSLPLCDFAKVSLCRVDAVLPDSWEWERIWICAFEGETCQNGQSWSANMPTVTANCDVNS